VKVPKLIGSPNVIEHILHVLVVRPVMSAVNQTVSPERLPDMKTQLSVHHHQVFTRIHVKCEFP
jgi:hypothetical protein